MIKNTKQCWEIGQEVNVGFLKGLTVLAKVMTPGDYAPDAYVLARGASFYSFVPHNGLTKTGKDDAACMIEDGKRAQSKRDAKLAIHAKALAEADAFKASILSAA